MKKLMLSAIITVLTSATLKADLGSCLVYHAAFYLRDGTNFKGCFEVSGYNNEAYLDDNGVNPFCNDKGVLALSEYGKHVKTASDLPLQNIFITYSPSH
jgi:hypothetical protein